MPCRFAQQTKSTVVSSFVVVQRKNLYSEIAESLPYKITVTSDHEEIFQDRDKRISVGNVQNADLAQLQLMLYVSDLRKSNILGFGLAIGLGKRVRLRLEH